MVLFDRECRLGANNRRRSDALVRHPVALRNAKVRGVRQREDARAAKR